MSRRRGREVAQRLARFHEVEVAHTESRGHAVSLARGAAEAGTDLVIVAAGDGTLNEAAAGTMGTATALAALPGGSTNVFARSIGTSNRIRPAIDQIVTSLERGSRTKIGVGSVNGRLFLFHLGVGFDAKVIARVEHRRRLKRWAAHPMFAAAAVSTFMRGVDRRKPSFSVTRGAEELGRGSFAIVSNQKPYTYFGPRPLVVTRAAGLDRALSLTLFRDLRVGAFGPAAFSALVGGRRIEEQPNVLQVPDVDELGFVALGEPFAWQVDGEYLGETDRLVVTYEPTALEVVLPITPNGHGPAR